MATTVSRSRRAEIQRLAARIRRSQQRAGSTTARISTAIRDQLPEVSPLEAWRLALGWSRAEAIEQVAAVYTADGLRPPGLNEPMLCRWEHDAERPGPEYAAAIARAYGTTPPILGLTTARTAHQLHGAATVAEPEPEEEPVRRRDMMTGALGLGAGLIAPAAPADALERALFEPPAADRPATLHRLRTELTNADAAFRDARYATAAAALPQLIARAQTTRDAATGQDRDRANALLARAYTLTTELALKQRSDTAWVASDRALVAARASGNARSTAEAARVLAITMRRSGRGAAAADFLARTAAGLGTAAPQDLAIRACLLLTAAYTAATSGRRADALALMDEAEETTSRLPAGARLPGLSTVTATPDQCALYRIGVHTALGTPDEGVPYISRIVPARFPTTERRARYLTDTARMWHHIGNRRRTFDALQQLEHAAPEEVRRPSVRALTTALLYGPTTLPGMRDFALRTGAVA